MKYFLAPTSDPRCTVQHMAAETPRNRYEVAAFLRAYAPMDVDQDRLHRCLDAVESPWSRREENQLCLVWFPILDPPTAPG